MSNFMYAFNKTINILASNVFIINIGASMSHPNIVNVYSRTNIDVCLKMSELRKNHKIGTILFIYLFAHILPNTMCLHQIQIKSCLLKYRDSDGSLTSRFDINSTIVSIRAFDCYSWTHKKRMTHTFDVVNDDNHWIIN